MTSSTDKSLINLYQTAEHACAYFPYQTSRMLVVDPSRTIDQALYSQLIQSGFRRSGTQIYQPNCTACDECKPLRVIIKHFSPSRAQRRTLARNSEIRTSEVSPQLNEEQFELYKRYIRSRHPGGGMDNPEHTDTQRFFTTGSLDTRFIEFRLNTRLVAVAVTDILDHALSAVYTFFDPELNQRSMGSFAILWQIDYCRKLNLPWLYLGYWLKQHPKMSYKCSYRPHQILTGHGWQTQK